MLNVTQELLAALAAELDKRQPGAGVRAAFESPKVAAHGDLACTAALQLAKGLQQNPRQLGEALREALLATPAFERWVAAIELAGPGFINIRLKDAAKQAIVTEVLQAGDDFGCQPATGERVLVEFVSANPTGPLHVGHGRQAALGDAICNLLATQGLQVYREFYYNDAGVQINTLATSTQLRARGCKPGDAQWPEAAYNGDYIQDIANDFLARKTVQADDRSFTASGDVNDLEGIRQFAVAYLRHEQDLDLQAFAVRFDNYYLESSLYTEGHVQATVQQLINNGKTYEQEGALWLRTTDYGDDKDRVMRKGDGSYTYFVPDVAYHIQKFRRGFTRVVNIQGTWCPGSHRAPDASGTSPTRRNRPAPDSTPYRVGSGGSRARSRSVFPKFPKSAYRARRARCRAPDRDTGRCCPGCCARRRSSRWRKPASLRRAPRGRVRAAQP